ncbi:prepilin peptidase [Pseudomonas sp. WS 5532]|uniref:prepilin peptidase n=1 Tax=Pseudomonas sp. WS 5532 TaxID=2717495 RepID=UPI00147653BE|nr:A24 family peptidase [Pseudomonas sp. WS 5532]NMX77775.1 prepilin peptidase [Pseudomonas sp. WS 5532]
MYLHLFVIVASVLAGCVASELVQRLPGALERSWQRQAQDILGLTPDLQPTARQRPGLTLNGRCLAIIVANVAVSLAIVWQAGFGWKAAALLLLSWALLTLALIDAEHYLLPDDLVGPVLWLGLLTNSFGLITNLQDAVWGAACGYLSLWSINFLFRLLIGRDGMGNGDFKLLALLGAWGGWQLVPIILLSAAVLGLMFWSVHFMISMSRPKRELPFGPSLALAGGLTIVFADPNQWAHLFHALSANQL